MAIGTRQSKAASPLFEELASQDLALGTIANGVIRIRPFDAPAVDRKFPLETLSGSLDYRWNDGSTGVAFFQMHTNLQTQPSIAVVDAKGRTLWMQPVSGALDVPIPSPDLNHVAYLRRTKTQLMLQVLDKTGKIRETASAPFPASLPLPSEFDYSVAWSPDGTKLAFSWSQQIRIHDLLTGETNIFGEGTEPGWSPNGRYFSLKAKGRLVILDRGKEVFRTLRQVGRGPSAVWSPQGDHVVYSEISEDPNSGTGLRGDITVLQVAGGAKAVLWTNNGLRIRGLGWITNWRDLAATLPRTNSN